MINGKIKAALRLLTKDALIGNFRINGETLKELNKKHPKPAPFCNELLLQGPKKLVHPVIFENITADFVQKLAFRTKGTAGPSQLDADEWRKLVVSKNFGTSGNDLCAAVARMARILATEVLEEKQTIDAFLACRLIPLDKNPGLRPIGVGEVLRRIIGKAVTSTVKNEIIQAA